MSGHATYVPKSDAGKWLEKRLPIISLMHSAAVSMPNPRNLNYWWVFGGIAMFMLIVQIVTGIVLAMHYTPQADMAFNSVEHIMRDVNWGWLLRYTHATGASMFFIAVYIHILRGMYYGSYKAPREVLWLLGMLIYFLMMATGFMGYVLPWGQMSFWGATVITNFFEVVPFIGDDIRILLWGGFAVDNPTLNRFFSLHYLLPFVIVAVVVLHIWALHVPGSNNPLGVEAKTKQDTLSFHPYFTMKDLYGIVLFAIILFYFVFFNPNFMGHPDNYIPANPLVTPAHIVPEWYYLPFYAILRAIPDKAMGVAGMFGAILIMFVVPWLDTSKVRSAKFRPAYRIFFWIFVFNGLLLGYFGQVSTTDNFLGIDGITNLIVSRFSTFYYFAFFVVVLPLLGLIEKTKPLPNSISEAVLGEEGAAEEAADLAAVDAKA